MYRGAVLPCLAKKHVWPLSAQQMRFNLVLTERGGAVCLHKLNTFKQSILSMSVSN